MVLSQQAVAKEFKSKVPRDVKRLRAVRRHRRETIVLVTTQVGRILAKAVIGAALIGSYSTHVMGSQVLQECDLLTHDLASWAISYHVPKHDIGVDIVPRSFW